MPKPNPFPLWGENPESMTGRSEETGLFKTYLKSIIGSNGIVIEITGAPGTGKTLLMRMLRRIAAKERFICPYIKAEKNERIESLVSKLKMETIGFLHTREYESTRPEPFANAAEHIEESDVDSVEDMRSAAITTTDGLSGTLFFIDDIEKTKKPEFFMKKIARMLEEGMPGIGFVISSGISISDESSIKKFALGPLSRHDVEEFISKSIGKGPPKIGEKCMESIMTDSGGNPRLVRTILWLLFERLKDTDKIITKRHYLAALPVLTGMLGREWFGRMYNSTPSAERDILKVLAMREKQVHVSEVSDLIGRPMGQTTALIGRLLQRGQIVRPGRGAYAVFAPLYGRYVREVEG